MRLNHGRKYSLMTAHPLVLGCCSTELHSYISASCFRYEVTEMYLWEHPNQSKEALRGFKGPWKFIMKTEVGRISVRASTLRPRGVPVLEKASTDILFINNHLGEGLHPGELVVWIKRAMKPATQEDWPGLSLSQKKTFIYSFALQKKCYKSGIWTSWRVINIYT